MALNACRIGMLLMCVFLAPKFCSNNTSCVVSSCHQGTRSEAICLLCYYCNHIVCKCLVPLHSSYERIACGWCDKSGAREEGELAFIIGRQQCVHAVQNLKCCRVRFCTQHTQQTIGECPGWPHVKGCVGARLGVAAARQQLYISHIALFLCFRI